MLLGLDSNVKVIVFVGYIALWTNQLILSHLAMTSSGEYSKTAIVLVTDLLKFAFALIGYSVESSQGPLGIVDDMYQHRVLFLLYAIPSGMYVAYNNLSYVALTYFDPATYSVLMQLRIVVTGLLSVIIINRRITPMQWIALLVITFGGMLKEVNIAGTLPLRDSTHYFIIVVQLLLSAGAGVYTEQLLKGRAGACTSLQNLFMYFHGLWLDIVIIAFNGELSGSLIPDLSVICSTPVLIGVVVNAAVTGVVTGYFLRILGSLLKSIASALEIPAIAVASFVVFGYPISPSTGFAIALVCSGVFLYSNPAPKKLT